MTSESISASADRDHDLELVAVGHQGGAMRAARHDLAVLLHRDLAPGERHAFHQLAHRERAFVALRRAVHKYLNHRANDTIFTLARPSYSGNTLASQANAAGSIPAGRSIPPHPRQ